MRAGALRVKAEIQSPPAAETVDDLGEPSGSWTLAYTRWVSVEPLGAQELFNAAQLQSKATHKVRLRYLSGLTSKHRFKVGSRYWYIQGQPVNVMERNREMIAQVVEGDG